MANAGLIERAAPGLARTGHPEHEVPRPVTRAHNRPHVIDARGGGSGGVRTLHLGLDGRDALALEAEERLANPRAGGLVLHRIGQTTQNLGGLDRGLGGKRIDNR